jgi:transcriptional regulator with XRE-family HTH domain
MTILVEISILAPMTIQQIGQLIQQRRKILKLKQEDISEMTGINIRTIYQIENGNGNPSFNTMEKLADVLGLEVKIQMKETIWE